MLVTLRSYPDESTRYLSRLKRCHANVAAMIASMEGDAQLQQETAVTVTKGRSGNGSIKEH